MSRINSRAKGSNGEREAAKWLHQQFKLEHLPERNLEQVRYKGKGKTQMGHDLIGFQPFCFEIKRCETLSYRDWWLQCVTACTDEYPIPVVMFRQTRKQWEFLISAKEIGCRNGFLHLHAREFVMWATKIIDK